MSEGMKKTFRYITIYELKSFLLIVGIGLVYSIVFGSMMSDASEVFSMLKNMIAIMLLPGSYAIFGEYVSSRSMLAISMGATRRDLIKFYPYIKLIVFVQVFIVFMLIDVSSYYFDNASICNTVYLFDGIRYAILISITCSMGNILGSIPIGCKTKRAIVGIISFICLLVFAFLLNVDFNTVQTVMTDDNWSLMSALIGWGLLASIVLVVLLLEIAAYVVAKKRIMEMEVKF